MEDFLSKIQIKDVIEYGMPIITLIMSVVFLVLGFVLDFHWRKYAYNSIALFIFRLSYFGIGLLLLGIMRLAQVLYA